MTQIFDIEAHNTLDVEYTAAVLDRDVFKQGMDFSNINTTQMIKNLPK